MALQIHMPLVSDITNYGTSTIITQNSGAVLASSGAPIDSNTNFNGSYSFNNSNSYISLTGADLYNTIKGGSQPFTITMWVYHNDSTRAILFGDYGLSGAINFNVELTTSHTLRFYWNGSPDTAPSAASVGLKTWAYIGIVYNGSTIKFFVNGALKYTHTGTLTTLTKSSGSYYLGRDSRTGTTTLNGNLNDFRLYNEALTESQINSLYYTDTEVTPIVINKLTQSQYESITPDDTQLYLITDANLETTNHKVQTIDASSTNTQYPSATAVNNVKYRGEPFYIEADGGSIGFAIIGTMPSKHIAYSFDKVTWTDTTIQNLIVNIPSTKRVYFRSNDTTDLAIDSGDHAFTGYAQFSISDDYYYEVGGRLDSLFNYASAGKTFMLFGSFSDSLVIHAKNLDVNHEGTACVCDSMFSSARYLVDAPVLSAITLPAYAYANMFEYCSSLKEAPALPAETLSESCYAAMFASCTSLRDAPPIMAKTLAPYCCSYMFSGCTSLETAPELYATTMVSNCYASMFSGCTSLRQIPRLYATELATSCYRDMFYRCSSLELQETADGTHYNIVKIPEKPQYDWTLTWNNSMVTTPDGTVTMADTLVTGGTVDFMPIQYFRDTTNGSSANASNHWNEIQAYTPSNVNIARGLPVVGSNGSTYTNSVATDGVINASYIDLGTGTRTVTVNLGSLRPVSQLKIWHYYSDGRTYHDNVTEVSMDGTNWTQVYSGEKAETSSGNTIALSSTWTGVQGQTLSGLTFSSNSVNYDSIYVDASGNMYYGVSGVNTQVYDVSTGWISDNYKTLTISPDAALFEDLFTGDWAVFKEINFTIVYSWDTRGLSLTGLNFKSNNTNYTSLSVNDDGDTISYNDTAVYYDSHWRDGGYLYDRTGGWYLNNLPTFNEAYKIIIYYSNSGSHGSVAYTWQGVPSTIQGATGNKFLVNGVEVTGVGGIINWQVYSTSGSNTSGFNTKTFVTSPYQTLASSYSLAQHFTSTDWSGFFETNKNTNASSTITVPSGALTSMFSNTGGTWTGTPVINKAYFTNAVLIPEANMSQTDAGYAEIWWKDILVSSEQSLYSLLTTTTFNGTSDYIDTNIKVLNGDPTFSIFVDFQQTALTSDMKEVIHCNTEVSPYPGLSLDYNASSGIRLAYYNKVNAYTRDTNRHKAIYTHNAGGKNVCTCYYDSTTAVPTTGTTAYSNVDRNLLIGCYQDSNGNKGRFLNGTIYSCIVLDRIFTSSEISSLMSGSFPSTINWSVKNQILSVKFICNGTLYNKLKIDSDGSMYYGQGNVYTIVYNVNTDTWTEGVYKKIQVLSSISSTFVNEWRAFLSQSKLY